MTNQPSALPALRQPMRRVLRLGTGGFLAALPLATLIGFLIDGASGAWGALLGMAIPVAFFSVTAAVALWTARVRPEWLGAAVLGSWLIKVIVLIAVLAWLSNADFYNRAIFFVMLLIGTIGYLVVEAAIVLRTRVPYVDPSA